MSNFLKYTLICFAVVTIIFGVPLLLAPGKFLAAFGWGPIDPLISRMLGAALLGLAWACLRAIQPLHHEKARLLVEVNAVFCTLATIGLLRHLLFAWYPPMVWYVALIYAIFAILFFYHWIARPRTKQR
jgi:O-antigen/teichoic acid export membrane protein